MEERPDFGWDTGDHGNNRCFFLARLHCCSAAASSASTMAATAGVETQGEAAAAVVNEFNRWKEGVGAGDESSSPATPPPSWSSRPPRLLSAACDMFVRYVVTRRTDDDALARADFAAVRLHLIRHAKKFGDISLKINL